MEKQTTTDAATVVMPAPTKEDLFIPDLLSAYSPFLDSIIKRKDELKVQIIYTRLDRGRNGNVRFTDHFFNVDTGNYFYPASTVKLPIAVLALLKLKQLNIPGLDKYTTMVTEAGYDKQTAMYNDPSTEDGRPCIANYIKKILLVSDNDAFNRLYEFLGQEYINNTLHEMGYTDAQIIHRLDVSMTEDQNRHTNPIRFYDKNSNVIYEQPVVASQLVYASRDTRIGKGFMRGDQLINEPFDFSKKNRLSLWDLHNIVRSIMFPSLVSTRQRFNLAAEDNEFLRRYMSMMPPESKFPSYDSSYNDTYVKFLLYGAEKGANPDIRVFNKTGDAYGFMIDAAYIVDYARDIEFMLSAVIYCNSDGVLNDDHYDYKTLGLPFFKQLGEAIYQEELKRERKRAYDLSTLKLQY